MAMLLLLLLYVLFVWAIIWGYAVVLYLIDIFERKRDNKGVRK